MAGTRRSTRRSDEIRRRRIRQSRQVKQTPLRGKRTVTQPKAPPVMTRGPLVESGQCGSRQRPNRSSQYARRRYDVALNAQGAEIRLPTLPHVRVGWRLASFLLFAFLAFVLYQFWNSPMYRVDAAQVSGLQRLTSGDVNAVLGVTGKQVFSLDAASMQVDLVSYFPEFSMVSVKVELPQTVVITVTERVPVLVWRQEGHSELVDIEGMTFPLREGMLEGSYPVIEAAGDPPPLSSPDPSPPPPEFPDLDALAQELSLDLPVSGEAERLLSAEMVSAIMLLVEHAPPEAALIYDPLHGLGWRDRRDWAVFYGDVQDLEMKLIVYKAILQELKAQELRPTVISVEYVHAPYFRLE